MRLLSLLPQSLLLFSTLSAAASSWTFADGSLTVSSKGTLKDGGVKEKYAHMTIQPLVLTSLTYGMASTVFESGTHGVLL